MGPLCIKYPTMVAWLHEITAHRTRGVETPGQKGRFISELLASDSAGHSSVAGRQCGSLHRPLSKLHYGAAGAAAAAPLRPQQHSRAKMGAGGTAVRCGGASRLQWRAPEPLHPDISVEREKGSRGSGGKERRTAELSRRAVRGRGRGRGSPPAFGGLETQGCKARAGGCDNSAEVGTYHGTQWRGWGRTWSPRGAPASLRQGRRLRL